MIPAEFEYRAPKSLEEALRMLGTHGDKAKLLAGGHSLLPLMKLRLASPRVVIDLGHIAGMGYIREAEGQIAIGAMTTHAAVAGSELLTQKCPLMAETAAHIGDMQVRNRGTLGGSLAHADPAGDYPAAVLVLDAQIVAASSDGRRTIPATEFFVDLLTTQLRAGEILVEVLVPIQKAGSGSAYCKMFQPASGYAVVGVAALVTLSRGGVIEKAAVGVTGVGAKAYRASEVEGALRGKKVTDKLLADAAQHAADGVEPLADIHGSAEYRREMVCVYARRALEAAVERAGGRGGKKSA
jgi:aerobic carbon-monoxide dehydrogenase medium subunit